MYLLLSNVFHRKLHYRIFSSLHATMTHGTLITLKYLFSMKQKQKLPMMLLSPSKQRLIFLWTLLIFQNCKKVLLFPMTGQKKDTANLYLFVKLILLPYDFWLHITYANDCVEHICGHLRQDIVICRHF